MNMVANVGLKGSHFWEGLSEGLVVKLFATPVPNEWKNASESGGHENFLK